MTTRTRLATLAALVAGLLALGAIQLSGLAAAGSTVKLKDDKFSPTSITIKKGTKLTFKWAGKHPHNVHGTGASSFKSSVKTSGTYSYTFKKKGTVKLVCDVHPGMKATVKVK